MSKLFAIGLMSGTSMDGVDASLIETDGCGYAKSLCHVSLKYPQELVLLLKAAEFSVNRHKGDLFAAKNSVDKDVHAFLQMLSPELKENLVRTCKDYLGTPHVPFTLNAILHHFTLMHIEATLELLKKAELRETHVNVVGFHGQTLYHAPFAGKSIQVGDGKKLAAAVKIKVIDQFRQHDIQMGGQGAPLAPIYHQAKAAMAGIKQLGIINCGGIANITLINGTNPENLIGFDCGPGNTLIDRFMMFTSNGQYLMDEDGWFGARGNVDHTILKCLTASSCVRDGKCFYSESYPKSLDVNELKLIPELFNMQAEDAVATLEYFTAYCMVESLKEFSPSLLPNTWVCAGGGWKNPVIREAFMQQLKEVIKQPEIITPTALGIDPTYLESEMMAYLAVRSLKQLPLTFPNTTGVKLPTTGGQQHLS